VLNYIFVSRLE